MRARPPADPRGAWWSPDGAGKCAPAWAYGVRDGHCPRRDYADPAPPPLTPDQAGRARAAIRARLNEILARKAAPPEGPFKGVCARRFAMCGTAARA